MRLLNTSSLELKEFIGFDIPPYVILSHTWGDDEALFDDIRTGAASSRRGYAKVLGCCRKAASDGYGWAWIDTCCIDKSSSAELSEAINSMYQWYQRSDICYAYLQDVTVDGPYLDITEFSGSRWFTRGWTLQELIAPHIVEFYMKEWAELGTKAILSQHLGDITGIRQSVLRGEDPPSTCTVAERMPWVAARSTTRKEDLAYCLLGLFGVNMPLLYGEGSKAFVRLQEHIMKQEEDYTMFAWSQYGYFGEHYPETGLLALSPISFSVPGDREGPGQPPTLDLGAYPTSLPAEKDSDPRLSFHDCIDYSHLRLHNIHAGSPSTVPQEPPQITSRGIRANLHVLKPRDPDAPLLAWIYCTLDSGLVCILLERKLPTTLPSTHVWGRCASSWFVIADAALLENFVLEELYLHPSSGLDEHSLSRPVQPNRWGRLRVEVPSTSQYVTSVVSAWPPERWRDDLDGFFVGSTGFFFSGEPPIIGAVLFETVIPRDTAGHVPTRFIVFTGIHQGLWWCQIAEAPISSRQSSPGSDSEQLRAMFVDAEGPHTGHAADFSDRATTTVQGAVIYATVRRTPSEDNLVSTYTLRVSASDGTECDCWVSLFVRSS